MDSVDL